MVGTSSSALIGRDDELAHARRLLASNGRLVTFVGPPGVGKTRVLRQLARELAREGADVRLVFLRDVDPTDVLASVVRALLNGARTAPRATAIARAAERMEERATVLVLDEAEHVREEVAELVSAWLDGTTRPRILVSSRERLDIPHEHVVRLEPLPPDAAGALLRDALARAASQWTITDDDVRRLVARVDGLPLGVELLASRVSALGVESVLASTTRTLALPMLDELLDESFELLDEGARFALAALSVFRDGFTVQTAATILDSDAAATKAIRDLADASLLRRTEGPARQARFEMLTVVRSFAVQKLAATGLADEIAGRHLKAFTRLAELPGSDLSAERQNLLAAFDHAKLAGDVRAAQHLAIALDPVLVRHGPPDLHRDVMLSAIALASTPRGSDPTALADLHRAYARFLALRGRFGEALTAARRASALAKAAGDRRVEAWVTAFECFVLRPLGALEDAEQAGRAALAYAHDERDLRLEAMAEQALGLVEHARGDHAAALGRYVQALAAARRAGDERAAGIVLANRALASFACADYDAAGEALADARSCFGSIDDRYHLARIAPIEVALARATGDLHLAESRFAGALEAVRDQGDLACEVELLLEGARVAALRGARAGAEARLAEARLVGRGLEDVFLAAEVDAVDRDVRRAERGELTLTVDAGARTVELAGPGAGRVRIDLSRRAALRKIFVALLDRHALGGRGLTLTEVLEAGWPGERMRADSASARVYMAIRRLRALGLEEVIVTTEEGYALSSLVRVVS